MKVEILTNGSGRVLRGDVELVVHESSESDARGMGTSRHCCVVIPCEQIKGSDAFAEEEAAYKGDTYNTQTEWPTLDNQTNFDDQFAEVSRRGGRFRGEGERFDLSNALVFA